MPSSDSFGPLLDLSDFSSRGPRRNCSNAAKCPAEADGVHAAFNGTSMATPHVAGAVAPMLQQSPSLTPEDVKRAMFTSAQKTAFTPALPVHTGPDVPAAPDCALGYGVLDAAKAVATAGEVAPPNSEGLWWNSPPGSESGWGINFTHQGNTIFATWFTCDASGKPLWMAAPAQLTAPGVYTGDLVTTTGPAFDAVPFNPGNVVETTVGTATLTFVDGNSANFACMAKDVSRTRPITRQVFAPPGTVCR